MTVVELMVSLLLAAMLSAGLFYMMTGQTNTYRNQLKSLSTQQNVWAAMEYLQRQIRSAGYGMAGCPNGVNIPMNLKGVVGLRVYNNCSLYKSDCTNIDASGSGTGTDAHGVDSLAVTVGGGMAELSGGLGAIQIVAQWNGNQTETAECGGLDVAGMTPMMAVFWNPADPTYPCTLATITEAKGGKKDTCKITTTNGGDPWDINDPAGMKNKPPYPPGSQITILGKAPGEPIKFAIDVDHDPPRLMQWQVTCASDSDCDPADAKSKCQTCPPGGKCVNKRCTNDEQVIAVGIEDMQITYACDYGLYSTSSGGPTTCNRSTTPWTGTCKGMVTPDGTYYEGETDNQRKSDEWAYNVASDNPPGCYLDSPAGCSAQPPPTGTCTEAPIGVVRITLVARGASPEVGTKPQARLPNIEDRNNSAAPLDSYDRAVLTTTVVPRNLSK